MPWLSADAQTVSCRDFERALEIAARHRGISPSGRERCRVLDESEFRVRIRALAQHGMTPNAMTADAFVAKSLALATINFPYQLCMYGDADSSVAAVYDYLNREVLLSTNRKAAFHVLVHEAVHVLQDQKYNLRAFYQLPKTTDERFAVRAIAEGDAI